MREFITDSWNAVMNAEVNLLRHIPHLHVRHIVLQVLAWMWCITFAMMVGSWTVFGVSAIALLLLGAIAVTVLQHLKQQKKTAYLSQSFQNWHTTLSRTEGICGLTAKELSRSREGDKGGEHE